ncbi:hypothetical protein GH714_025394 [Hevea brasiliensis]|uniref:Uncharacterized protein n=1 Tax=Hevea brasiliensis TaxID=3981 RepID=A0A6A6MM39_HEVBR|nr:hypothetical protein GH714_025394 [Hevea brasiliensis]
MAKDRNGSLPDKDDKKSKGKGREDIGTDSDSQHRNLSKQKREKQLDKRSDLIPILQKKKIGKAAEALSENEDQESDAVEATIQIQVPTVKSPNIRSRSLEQTTRVYCWLAEVKQVNLESLPNWEEKQMFKNSWRTTTQPPFHLKSIITLMLNKHKIMEKEMKKGFKKVLQKERTVFNDEEQRRLELLQERERHKEQQVEALKLSMQSGMAQAMKEQVQLKEEMAYQYKLGNFEAAAAIQRRLDPNIAM